MQCLSLCHSIQQLHFYLLIFVNTYTKLLSLMNDFIASSAVHVCISPQLTEIKNLLDKAIAHRTRGVYDVSDSETNKLLRSMTEVQGLRYLQELIANHQVQKALSLLHAMRYSSCTTFLIFLFCYYFYYIASFCIVLGAHFF